MITREHYDGSGKNCDGQVLVIQDLLGMYDKIKPKFVKKYMNLSEDIVSAIKKYKTEIQEGVFPANENCFQMDIEEIEKLRKKIGS